MGTASTIEPLTTPQQDQPRTRTPTMNPKQLTFISEYLKTNNATQSAITAGYSPKSARSIAYDNLHRPYIMDYINDLRLKTTNEQVLSILERKQILSELARRKAKDTINAISELNKMEQVYSTAGIVTGPITINYVLATKDNVKRLEENIERRLLQEDRNELPIEDAVIVEPTKPIQQHLPEGESEPA